MAGAQQVGRVVERLERQLAQRLRLDTQHRLPVAQCWWIRRRCPACATVSPARRPGTSGRRGNPGERGGRLSIASGSPDAGSSQRAFRSVGFSPPLRGAVGNHGGLKPTLRRPLDRVGFMGSTTSPCVCGRRPGSPLAALRSASVGSSAGSSSSTSSALATSKGAARNRRPNWAWGSAKAVSAANGITSVLDTPPNDSPTLNDPAPSSTFRSQNWCWSTIVISSGYCASRRAGIDHAGGVGAEADVEMVLAGHSLVGGELQRAHGHAAHRLLRPKLVGQQAVGPGCGCIVVFHGCRSMNFGVIAREGAPEQNAAARSWPSQLDHTMLLWQRHGRGQYLCTSQ